HAEPGSIEVCGNAHAAKCRDLVRSPVAALGNSPGQPPLPDRAYGWSPRAVQRTRPRPIGPQLQSGSDGAVCQGGGVAAQPSWARKARRGTALAAVALAVASLLNVVTGSTLAQAKTSPGATTRVSVHEDGSQVAESQGPNSQISGNGRFV